MTEENGSNSGSGQEPRRTYVLKWYYGAARNCCFIRGVEPDGSFYGEVTIRDTIPSTQTNVSGILTSAERGHFSQLAEMIAAQEPVDGNGQHHDGFLAVGPISHPRVIYRFRNEEPRSSNASRFIQMTEILVAHFPTAAQQKSA